MVLGVWPADGEAELGVGVVTDPKFLPGRSAVLERADSGGLQEGWGRHLAGWEALKIRERLVSFPDHGSAAAWLTGRLHELASVGVLLPTSTIPTE